MKINKDIGIVMNGGNINYTKLCVLPGSTVTSDDVVIAHSMLDGNIIMGKVSIHGNQTI